MATQDSDKNSSDKDTMKRDVLIVKFQGTSCVESRGGSQWPGGAGAVPKYPSVLWFS